MAYGIESYGSSGYLQFSTETQENFTVIDTGATSYGATETYDNEEAILCFNLTSTGGILKGNHTSDTEWVNLSKTPSGSNKGANWIKLKRTSVSGVSAEDSAGGYGLRVFNSSGALTYGSNFSKGQEILDVIGAAAALGGGNPVPYNGNQNPVIYSGNPAGVYVSVPQQTSQTGSDWKAFYNWLYFDYTNNVIRFASGYMYSSYWMGDVWIPRSNTSAMMIFKQKG